LAAGPGEKNVTWLPGKPAQNTEIGLFVPERREKRTFSHTNISRLGASAFT